MDVSVVIPTFNRAALLHRTLPALMAQTGGLDYEVIFVSNGSSDETEDFLRAAEREYPGRLRYYRIDPTGGPSAPRNFGIRQATSDIVIILDDDVLPDPGLVRGHYDFHQKYPEPHHAAIGEAYVPDESLTDPMSFFHVFPYDQIRHMDRLGYLFFWTCDVSFKRQFMLEMGMFDESLLAYEDMVCGYKLENSGMHLHFASEGRGQHLHQFKAAGVEAKGIFYGLWLHPLELAIPERAVHERFGMLSRDLGPALFAKRLVNRAALLVLANALTYAILRAAGATSGPRSRVSDFYYYLLFRRNTVRGYARARRQARADRRRAAVTTHAIASPWGDRGE